MQHFDLRAGVFHTGSLCRHVDFDDTPALGYIHLLRSGRLKLETAGQPSRVLDEPAVVFYPRPALHRLVPLDEAGAQLVCARLEFDAQNRNPLTHCMPALLVLPLSEVGPLQGALELLFDEALQPPAAGRQAVLDRLCEVVVVQLLRHLMQTGSAAASLLAGLAHAGLAKALEAMHEQPAHAWALGELAALAGMSRSRFAATFRHIVGCTPGDYLADWRLSVAQSLLRRGRPLKLVAAEVGYATPSALARLFRSRLDVPPAAWLRAQTAGGPSAPTSAAGAVADAPETSAEFASACLPR